jgi:hypothetical protein
MPKLLRQRRRRHRTVIRAQNNLLHGSVHLCHSTLVESLRADTVNNLDLRKIGSEHQIVDIVNDLRARSTGGLDGRSDLVRIRCPPDPDNLGIGYFR